MVPPRAVISVLLKKYNTQWSQLPPSYRHDCSAVRTPLWRYQYPMDDSHCAWKPFSRKHVRSGMLKALLHPNLPQWRCVMWRVFNTLGTMLPVKVAVPSTCGYLVLNMSSNKTRWLWWTLQFGSRVHTTQLYYTYTHTVHCILKGVTVNFGSLPGC